MENEVTQDADIKVVKRISKAWLVPLVALSIGLWMVYYQWANQGPLITIEFSNATGLEPEKTKIKTRDVDIGLVKKIELKPDLTGVIVTARIDNSASHLLREQSNFWIVSPRVSLSGVSGLSTLLSGPYITMSPAEQGELTDEFVALENPPVTPIGTPGLHITLNSNDEFAFKEGDPIIYKGLQVGEFEDIYFNLEERIVYYNAFIEAPYHKLITENTKFWNTSGVTFNLAANGLQVQTGSLETLLTNGVTFGVPDGMSAGRQITQRAFFDIFPDYQTASDQRYKLGAEFVVMINETVRGLQVGAPVEYRGLKIGEVLEINLQGPLSNGLLDEGYSIPVLVTIQPGRIQLPDNQQGLERVRAQTLHWIENGLRASLKIGNILTGGLYVDLQHYEGTESDQLLSFMGYDVIPTRSNEFAQITQKITALLDTFNELPLQSLGDNVNTTLGELDTTLQTVTKAANSLDVLLADTQRKDVAQSLNQTLSNIDDVLHDFSAGSRTHNELINTMHQIQLTLSELTPLLQQINSVPNSLIFAEDTGPALIPKGVQPGETQLNEGNKND